MHQKFSTLQKLLDYVLQSKGDAPKAIYELGEVTAQLVSRIQLIVGVNTNRFQLTLDSFGVRHAFAGHSQERGSRDQHPLTEADMLALSDWLFTPDLIKEGAKPTSPHQPLRLQLLHVDAQQVKTVVILEVRPRYRRLVLVTMYKTENG